MSTKNSLPEIPKSYMLILKVLLGAAIAALVIYLIVKAVKAIKKAQEEKKLNGNDITLPGGSTVDLGSKAAEIHNALHGSMFYEDETTAINAIKGLPKSNIPQLEALYFNLYGINLKSDLIKYLSNSEYTSISHLF